MNDRQRVVAVTGALGFVASHLSPKLKAAGYRVVGVVRPGRDTAALEREGIEIRRAELSGELDAKTFAGASHAVHLAGLALVPGMVAPLEKAGVGRSVFVSSAGVHTKLESRGADAKRAGERALAQSSLDWVVLRPSMIYGTPADRNIVRLLRLLERTPILPLPGGGATLQQPVHVEDLADAILAALERPAASRTAYDVGGPEALSLHALVKASAGALGRSVWTPPLPLAPVHATVRLLRSLRLPSPVRPEQVLRLHESKAVDISPARRDLGFAPRPFADGVAAEVEMLRGRRST